MSQNFEGVAQLHAELHLFKVEKLDACTRPLFANPVTFRGSTVCMQCSKYGLEVGRLFIQNRNIITDYHWLPMYSKFVLQKWTLLGHMLK